MTDRQIFPFEEHPQFWDDTDLIAAMMDPPDQEFRLHWHVPEGTGPLWARLPDGSVVFEDGRIEGGRSAPIDLHQPMYGIRPHREYTQEQADMLARMAETLYPMDPEQIRRLVEEADLLPPHEEPMHPADEPDPDQMNALIEKSSLGTPEAKAARNTVSPEHGRALAEEADRRSREQALIDAARNAPKRDAGGTDV